MLPLLLSVIILLTYKWVNTPFHPLAPGIPTYPHIIILHRSSRTCWNSKEWRLKTYWNMEHALTLKMMWVEVLCYWDMLISCVNVGWEHCASLGCLEERHWNCGHCSETGHCWPQPTKQCKHSLNYTYCLFIICLLPSPVWQYSIAHCLSRGNCWTGSATLLSWSLCHYTKHNQSEQCLLSFGGGWFRSAPATLHYWELFSSFPLSLFLTHTHSGKKDSSSLCLLLGYCGYGDLSSQ